MRSHQKCTNQLQLKTFKLFFHLIVLSKTLNCHHDEMFVNRWPLACQLPTQTVSAPGSIIQSVNFLSPRLYTLQPYRSLEIGCLQDGPLITTPSEKESPHILSHFSLPNGLNLRTGLPLTPCYPFYVLLNIYLFIFELRNSLCCRHIIRYANCIGRITLQCRLYFPINATSINVKVIIGLSLLDSDRYIVPGNDYSSSSKNSDTHHLGARTIKTNGNNVDDSSTVTCIQSAFIPYMSGNNWNWQ